MGQGSKNTAAKARRVHFIFATILLDAMGLGLVIPVLPSMLARFNADPAVVSWNFGMFVGLYALMQFLASPILGSLSDRYGRRPLLLISLAVAAVDYLFMAFAPTLPLLFAGRLLSGLTGANMTVASSYMADISDDRDRGANFGMIGAGMGVGFVLGPLIGGLVAGGGPAAPFLIAAVLNGLNVVFGSFVLPESLAPEHRRAFDLKGLNPLGAIVRAMKPSPVMGLVWVYFVQAVAVQVHPVNWILYIQAKFGWTTWQLGASLSFMGLAFFLGNAGLPRLLIPHLGEERALKQGLWVLGITSVLFGMADRGWMMFLLTPVFAFSSLTMPALQSLLVKEVAPDRQGEMQGSLVSLSSLAAVISPPLYTVLFTTFTRQDAAIRFPGAAFLGAALIAACALLINSRRNPHLVLQEAL